VGSQRSEMMKMVPLDGGFSWKSYNEEHVPYDDNSNTVIGLLEQINITRDASDYMWNSTDIKIDPDEAFLKNEQYHVLTVLSAGHALHVFFNGQLLGKQGTVYGSLENHKLTFISSVALTRFPYLNSDPHFETWNAGVLGPVMLNDLNEGRRDLSWQKWSYKIGLEGEVLSLHSLSGSSSVEWVQGSFVSQKEPLTWYKTTFDLTDGNDPLALDMGSMGKGRVWINEQSIGRYWPAYKAFGTCGSCSYTGMNHVPCSWLNPSGNLLVIFEEWGGDPN
ncbi:hypothetical protein IFM89_037458, partial [Coptis chinensis]